MLGYTKKLDSAFVPTRTVRPNITPTARITSSAGTAFLFPTEPMPIAPQGVTLMEATSAQCHWPLWDNAGPYLVCGKAVKPDGKLYCVEHHARAYTQPRNMPAGYSEERSNILRIPKPKVSKAPKPQPKPKVSKAVKPKTDTAPRRNLQRARAALKEQRSQKPKAGPFGMYTLRGIVYALLLNNPMTVDDICSRTDLPLKRVRETLADISYGPNHQGRYVVQRDRKAGLVWITLPASIDVCASCRTVHAR